MLDFALLQQCAPFVAAQTMQSIISVESARKPHAIGYWIRKGNQRFHLAKQPRNKEEAMQWAQYFLQNGYGFDAGITQVNSIHFKRMNLTVENVFEPCTNIKAGATILSEFYSQALPKYKNSQEALMAAISAYQTGSYVNGFKTGYVQKVIRASQRISKQQGNQSHVPQNTTPPIHEEKQSPNPSQPLFTLYQF